MDVSGTVLRQITYISGVKTHAHSRGVVPRRNVVRMRMVMGSGFNDESHVQYYQDMKNREPVMSNKKKMKLLKRLSKDVSSFPQLGFASDSNQPPLFDFLQQNLTMGGGEELLRELEKVRAEGKELKKKMKQEKKMAKLEKLKASKMKTCDESSSESSSSSSESSDSDCGKVVDRNTCRGVNVGVATKPVNELELQTPALQSSSTMLSTIDGEDSTSHHHVMDLCSTNDASVVVGFKKESSVVIPTAQKRIEVCMGNKCKRSGAAALLQEFEKVVGVEGTGSVVGCKCMGKCKTAPNVRIQNSVDHSMGLGFDDSVKVPTNPLCIGVGLEDVDTIVARFLGENLKDMDMVAASS